MAISKSNQAILTIHAYATIAVPKFRSPNLEGMMSEFMDFLKHKCAYVAIGEFKPGKFEEAKHLYEQAIATYGEGFKGSYLLQEPGTDKGIAIILWNGADDMESYRTEAHEQILKQMSPLFAHAPSTAFYELVSEIDAEGKAVAQ